MIYKLPISALSIALFLTLAHAQGPQAEFEVAAIKSLPPQDMGKSSTRLSIDHSKVLYSGASVGDLIGQAYKVPHLLIFGPPWLNSDRFEINAKIPEGASEQLPAMFAALLASRFGLVFHREKRKLPCYVLSVAKKGPRFTKSSISGGLSAGNDNKDHLAWVKGRVSIAVLADYLSAQLDRPLLDQTHLDGSYNIDLQWVPAIGDPATLAAERPSGPALVTALREQGGIQMRSAKMDIEVFVVDKVARTPTEN